MDNSLEWMRYYNFNYLLKAPFGDPRNGTSSSSVITPPAKRSLLYSSSNQNSRNVSKLEEIHLSYNFFVASFSMLLVNILSMSVMFGSRKYKPAPPIPKMGVVTLTEVKISKNQGYLQLTIPAWIFALSVSEFSVCVFTQFRYFSGSDTNDDFKIIGLVLAIFGLIYLIGFLYYELHMLPKLDEEENIMLSLYFHLLRKKESVFASRFYGIRNLSKFIYSFFIVVSYDAPTIPILVIFLGELALALAVFFYRPFKQLSLNVLTIISKICVALMAFIMLIMTSSDERSSNQVNGAFIILVASNTVILFYVLYSVYLTILKSKEQQVLFQVLPENSNSNNKAVDSIVDLSEIDYLKSNMAKSAIDDSQFMNDYQTRKKILSNINRSKLITYDGHKLEAEQNLQSQQLKLQQLQAKGEQLRTQEMESATKPLNSSTLPKFNNSALSPPLNSSTVPKFNNSALSPPTAPISLSQPGAKPMNSPAQQLSQITQPFNTSLQPPSKVQFQAQPQSQPASLLNPPSRLQPIVNQPIVNQPIVNQPIINQSIVNQSIVNQSIVNQPIGNQLTSSQLQSKPPPLDESAKPKKSFFKKSQAAGND